MTPTKSAISLTRVLALRNHGQQSQKWDYSKRRNPVGRPSVEKEIVDLVLRFARENPSWGYDRIQGALRNLGHEVSDQTVGNILKEHGIEPAPKRKQKSTWKTFIKSHWDVLAAIDFTTIEVWSKGGLITYYLLFVMEVATRRVHFAGCTVNPNEAWMKQVAKNLTDFEEGFLNGKRYLIMDGDTQFCAKFRSILKDEGVKSVRLPPQSPDLNPHIERFVRSIKEECLSKMIFFAEKMLRTTIGHFVEHYHTEGNHQGLDNRLIAPGVEVGKSQGEVQSRERLGGLLRYYYRDAA